MGPYGHALYKHYNNGIISAFLKTDAGGGPETVLPLGVAYWRIVSELINLHDDNQILTQIKLHSCRLDVQVLIEHRPLNPLPPNLELSHALSSLTSAMTFSDFRERAGDAQRRSMEIPELATPIFRAVLLYFRYFRKPHPQNVPPARRPQVN